MTATRLAQLRAMTSVVADTGDLDAVRLLRPDDATTNPSLILAAVQDPAHADLPLRAAEFLGARGQRPTPARIADYLAVHIGAEMTRLVPGFVSTEVDARLSFDSGATCARAHELLDLYASLGVSRQRVLIKIAATWEGIRAAAQLEREGIRCNLTLLFSFAQAVACAEAGVFLISPFVGRIYDWHLAQQKRSFIPPEEDPGVQSVKRIHTYYKQHNYPTLVMGASFRHVGQIEALAGCDKLTISPDLLQRLDASDAPLERQLEGATGTAEFRPPTLEEAAFRWQLNEDAMATEKLADGIRRFAVDQKRLETLLQRGVS